MPLFPTRKRASSSLPEPVSLSKAVNAVVKNFKSPLTQEFDATRLFLVPMEKAQSETETETETETPKSSETAFSFAPRRRSHLKSETYFSLVRILSHCYNNSQIPHAAQVVPQELNPDNGNNELVQANEKEACENIKLVSSDGIEPNNLSIQKETVIYEAIGGQDRGLSGVDMVIDELELIMGIEENKDDMMVDERTEGTKEKMIMDELEDIVKGNKELVHENSINPSTTSLDKNQSNSDKVNLMIDQEEHVDSQNNSEAFDLSLDKNEFFSVLDPRDNGEDKSLTLKTNSLVVEHEMQKKDMEVVKPVSSSFAMNFPILSEIEMGENCSQKISDASDLSLDKDMINEPPKPSEDIEDKVSLLKTNALEVENETHQNERELEKSVYSSNPLNSADHMTENGDIEEGEILGDYGTGNKPLEFLEEAMVLDEENVDEVQISMDVIDKNEFHFNELNGANGKVFESTYFEVDTLNNAKKGREVEHEESDRNKMALRPEMVVHGKSMKAKKADVYDLLLEDGRNKKKDREAKEDVGCPIAYPNNLVLHGQISETNTTSSLGITYKEKQDASSCNKKKRSCQSLESKARKKRNKQKKQAEKNRELGVKRLKLHPVLKPKTIKYCFHYLNGRCLEGEKCKYSHDTVPLTKSKPCCFFASHSCMKGDDCPFDHQLSKYPCDRYVTNGFCSRGDDCMFSHEMPPREDSPVASNACKAELNPSSVPSNTNVKKQLNISGNSQQKFDALSYSMGKSSRKNLEKNVVETVLRPPVLASKGISHPYSVEKSSVFNSTKFKAMSSPNRIDGAKIGKQKGQSAADTIQKLNEIPKGTPTSVAPKGINFLSFYKAPLDDSSTKKLVSLPSNRDIGTKPTLSVTLNLQKQAISSPNNSDSTKAGNQTHQSASKTVQNLSEMLKKTQPTTTPQGMNSLSFGEASIDDSSNKKASFPSGCDTGIDRSVLERQSASEKSQNSSAISMRLPVSPFASCQSLERLASVNNKNAPNSVQKVLSLTQAFAAKYESKMKMNRSTSALAVATNLSKESSSIMNGSSEDDFAKSSRIVEFLSGGGGKTKQ